MILILNHARHITLCPLMLLPEVWIPLTIATLPEDMVYPAWLAFIWVHGATLMCIIDPSSNLISKESWLTAIMLPVVDLIAPFPVQMLLLFVVVVVVV